MALKPGHCARCDRLVWRLATAQRDHDGTKAGDTFLLWPDPTSLYVQTWTPIGHTVGIPYCQACAPEIGEPGPDAVGGAAVIGYETAKGRYREWYTDEKGAFFRAWLGDHLGYDAAMIEATMDLWRRDRGA